ncbi:MAG: polysaccharide biosynthesis protein [Flavobacteriales bacterium]|nr:polysaccharide biosynthesis protein [Flavobacteriales bacterium]
MLTIDELMLLFAIWVSFALRLGEPWPIEYMKPNWWLFLLIPAIAIPLFIKLGLYRAVLQYMGIKVFTTSFQAITITSLIVGFVMMMFREADLPRSVIFIFWFVSNTLVITSRFLFKGILYSWDNFVNDRKAVIIYGAGRAGAQLIESLRKSHDYAPVAFVDDDQSKEGTIINYTQVYSFKDLRNIIKKRKAKVLLLAIPSMSEVKKRELLKKLSKYPIEVKVLPSISSIVKGEVSIESIKKVKVEDILGRHAVEPKKSLLKKNISGKNVMITGAGGSIGSELCRQVLDLSPKKVILFEHSEFNLYSIHQELSKSRKRAQIIPVLADVTNAKKVSKIIQEEGVHTIYHAAAYKHVPMVEMNAVEGVYNNAVGTYNVAIAAQNNDVENLVLISTDKAVRPTNVMGASKRFSELVLQGLHKKNSSNTCFSMVRFGNVLDSAGSVVPLFRSQIQNGGPVTVTHRDVTRYFMSIPEAVQLVLQAGAMAKGGDVFVLDMGEPIRILDLAYRMVHLSGLTPIDEENPDGDIKIKVTGLRPGEKLYEELLIGDDVVQSNHPRIMQAKEVDLEWAEVEKSIKLIQKAHEEHDEKSVRSLLLKNVDGYKPSDH